MNLKRYRKLPAGSGRHWAHVVDARSFMILSRLHDCCPPIYKYHSEGDGNVTSSTPHNLITPLDVAIHRFFPFHNIYIHSRAGPGVKNFVKLRRRESLRERVRSIIDNIITMHHHHHERRGIHCHHHDPCHDFLCYHIVTREARVALTSSSSSHCTHSNVTIVIRLLDQESMQRSTCGGGRSPRGK